MVFKKKTNGRAPAPPVLGVDYAIHSWPSLCEANESVSSDVGFTIRTVQKPTRFANRFIV